MLKSQWQVKNPNVGLRVVLHGERGHAPCTKTELLPPAHPVARTSGWQISGEIRKRQVKTGEK